MKKILSFEEFKLEVEKSVINYLPKQNQNMPITTKEVYITNGKKDTLNIKVSNLSNYSVDIENMYELYKVTGDMKTILKKVGKNYEVIQKKYCISPSSDENLQSIKGRIVCHLVNTEQNRKMLEDMPHREFLDMSIIYAVIIDNFDNAEIISFNINRTYASLYLKLSEYELYDLAIKNTKKLFPTVVRSMTEILGILEENITNDKKMAKSDLVVMPADREIYVLSNNAGWHGATCILYEDVLEALACKLDSDLIILPSSIDEILAVSAKTYSPEQLISLVPGVNFTKVALNRRLSNQIYRYSRELNMVIPASNTSLKRLDIL